MPSSKKSHNQLPLIGNPKARHKFLIGDKYEAGIVLTGTEVKSIRSGNAQISNHLLGLLRRNCSFNAHIAEYEFGGDQNHAPQPKTLLKKKEIERIRARLKPLEKQSFRYGSISKMH